MCVSSSRSSPRSKTTLIHSFFLFLIQLSQNTDIQKEATLHLVLRLRGMISSFTSSTESYLTWKIIVKSGSIAAPLTHENNVVTQASGGFAGTLTANLGPVSTTVTVKSAVGQTLSINEDMLITLTNDASGAARDPILIPAASIESATSVTTEADVLTEWLLLTNEERAAAPPPSVEVLTQRMTSLNAERGKTFTTKTPEQTSTLISPSQREVCKRFMDAAHSIIAAESSDIKITLSEESFCVLFPGDDSSAQYARLMAEHPDSSKIALRRTEGPVDGCIGWHIDASSKIYVATHTVQIALNDDCEYNGGRLCFFTLPAEGASASAGGGGSGGGSGGAAADGDGDGDGDGKGIADGGGLTVTSRPAGTLTSHPAGVLHAVTKLHSGIRYGLFVVDHRNGLGEKDVHHLETDKVTAIIEVANVARMAAEGAAAAGFKTLSTALAETFDSQRITRVEARKALDESNGNVVVSTGSCAVVLWSIAINHCHYPFSFSRRHYFSLFLSVLSFFSLHVSLHRRPAESY